VTGGFIAFATRRLGAAIPTLFGVTLIVFFMVRMLPGDPARLLAGLLATQAEVDRIRAQLGLTKPVWVQYGFFMTGLVRGDLGRSTVTQAPSGCRPPRCWRRPRPCCPCCSAWRPA